MLFLIKFLWQDYTICPLTSEARVLQFAKRTRTGYYVGTGTRTVHVRYAPMTHQYLFFCFQTLVRLWYGGGTLRVHITVFFF